MEVGGAADTAESQPGATPGFTHMLISVSRKMIFLVAPKTGSTAAREYLRTQKFYLLHLTGQQSIPGFCGGANRNHRWLTGCPGGWTAAVTVRNHWDALVSWWAYTYAARGEQKFDRAFVESLMDDTHRSWFWPDPHRMWGAYTEHADTILRHETLEDDLSAWLDRPVALPQRNVSAQRAGRHYSEFYDSDLRDFVGEWYRDEIEELGYSFLEQEAHRATR